MTTKPEVISKHSSFHSMKHSIFSANKGRYSTSRLWKVEYRPSILQDYLSMNDKS